MSAEDTSVDDELNEMIDSLAEFVAENGYDKESVLGSLSDSIDSAYEDVESEEDFEDDEEEVEDTEEEDEL